MAKTRYARKISKRKGATKRRANTKRRVIKKKGRSMTKRRGGSFFKSFRRGANRLGNFGSKGVKNAASGFGNVATYTKNKASTAANYAADATNYAAEKASDATNYAADKANAATNYAKTIAQNRIAALKAAASEAACVGVDDELNDAMKSLEKAYKDGMERVDKANAKVERLQATQYRCNSPEVD